MRDLANNIAIAQSLAPALLTATDEGETVDRLGYESVTFAVHVGDWTDGTFVLSAEDSDDGISWDAVSAAHLVRTPPTIEGDGGSPEAATAANQTHRFGYVGSRRYVRPKVTVSENPVTGCFIGIDAILGHPHERPTA